MPALASSLCSFRGEKARDGAELRNLAWRQFLCVGRDRQFETIGGDFGPGFPCPNIEGVFREPDNLLAGYDIAARIRAGSMRDPDLPIDVLRPKGKVIAFNAMNNAAS